MAAIEKEFVNQKGITLTYWEIFHIHYNGDSDVPEVVVILYPYIDQNSRLSNRLNYFKDDYIKFHYTKADFNVTNNPIERAYQLVMLEPFFDNSIFIPDVVE